MTRVVASFGAQGEVRAKPSGKSLKTIASNGWGTDCSAHSLHSLFPMPEPRFDNSESAPKD